MLKWLCRLCLVLVASLAEDDCGLEALEAGALAEVEALAAKSLSAKLAERYVNLLKEPCSKLHRGLILMSFQLKNTAQPLGVLMKDIITTLDTPKVTHLWRIFPTDARDWMLKSFINGLPCTMKDGKCEEADTNDAVTKFEDARQRFALDRLEERGLEPFPEAKEDDDEEASREEDDDATVKAAAANGTTTETNTSVAMLGYAKRLKIDGDAARWLASQFADDAEPDWFSAVAPHCRSEARAKAPDTTAEPEFFDLDAVARLAEYAWYYKDCHRHFILMAYEARNNTDLLGTTATPDDAGAIGADSGEL